GRCFFFFFSSRRRHTRFSRDWSSDVCSSDLKGLKLDFNYAPHFWEEHSKVFHPAITTYHADGRVAYTKPQITSLSQRNDRNVAHNLRATLHLAKSFDAHNVGVLAGFQQENFSNRW